MNIKISSISEAGVTGKERIVMKVLRDTDIGQYAVLRTGFRAPSPTTGVTDAYWFPDKPVRRNDIVVLYSKSGTESEKQLENGATAHFFYWRAGSNLWSDNEHAAVVIEVNEFDFITKGMQR